MSHRCIDTETTFQSGCPQRSPIRYVSQNTSARIHLGDPATLPAVVLASHRKTFSARLAPEAPLIRLASSPGAEQHPLGSTAGAGTETVGKVKMTSLHLNDIVCLDCSHKCLLFLSASRIHIRLSCCAVYSRFISCSRHSLQYHLSLHTLQAAARGSVSAPDI